MKKLIFLTSLVVLFATASMSQVTKNQLKGVWNIAAFGKESDDSVVTFGQDTVIGSLVKDKIFTDLSVLAANATSDQDKMAFAFIGMLKGMFIQFDENNAFGEGMLEEDNGTPKVKAGTYTLDGANLTTNTKKEQAFNIAMKGEYLILTASNSGTVMYMKKIKDSPF